MKVVVTGVAGFIGSHVAESLLRDGHEVTLLGNIEFPYEVDHCLDRGADGIGLYRTEFLYLGSETGLLAAFRLTDALRPEGNHLTPLGPLLLWRSH